MLPCRDATTHTNARPERAEPAGKPAAPSSQAAGEKRKELGANPFARKPKAPKT